jgi:hypothetical protein
MGWQCVYYEVDQMTRKCLCLKSYFRDYVLNGLEFALCLCLFHVPDTFQELKRILYLKINC